ncbi:UNVERIFIED_CONTAM: hypothetical protein RMT77_005424 [Armadillidium vulgare]
MMTSGSNQKITRLSDYEPPDMELNKICATSLHSKSVYASIHNKKNHSLPTIYVITPTYKRTEMVPELTRISQTLLLVPNIIWILAEDAYKCSSYIIEFLEYLGMPYVYLVSPMPVIYRTLVGKPRGVSNRLAALEWIKKNGNDNGVFYFLDDDNTVSIKLFEEMRFTNKVSVWPVGMVGEFPFSTPVVNEDGKVIGFFDFFTLGRMFQIDMAGFAVNVRYFKNQSNVTMPYMAGYEEDGFLRSLGIQFSELEAKANLCTKILVWHTKTVKNKNAYKFFPKSKVFNLPILTRKFKDGALT